MERSAPRVNSHRMHNHLGTTVRIVGKILSWAEEGDSVILEASDGGQVTVRITNLDMDTTDEYVEIIGTVTDSSTIRMAACCNMGDTLNLNLVNEVIELTYDERFHDKMF